MTICYDIAVSRPKRWHGTAHGRKRDNTQAHQIAERLQWGVLLRTHPHEALPGLATEGFYQAALNEAMVGGDSFDAFPLADGRTALMVADASGKGLAAAERVAEVRFALRAFLREHADPSRALSCLNDFVCDSQCLGRRDDGTFATLTLVVLDGSSGEAACLCAGGEPPLVLRAGGSVEVIQICGAALGLSSRQGYAEALVRLGLGDSVLLATDGLTEARGLVPGGPVGSRTGAFLGLEGLARLAAQAYSPKGELTQIGRFVFEAARAFAGGVFHDDACLLVGQRQAQ